MPAVTPSGASSERYRQAPRQQHEANGFGEGVPGIDDHHRLEAAAPRPAGLSAHLAVVASTFGLRAAVSAVLRRAQLIPEVRQRVGLAVGVRGQRGAHSGEQVARSEPRVLDLAESRVIYTEKRDRVVKRPLGRIATCPRVSAWPMRSRRR